MLVDRYKNPILLNGLFKDSGVVSAFVAGFRSTNDVMASPTKEVRQIHTKHLIKVEAHSLRGIQDNIFSVANCVQGIVQGCFDIAGTQLWIAS